MQLQKLGKAVVMMMTVLGDKLMDVKRCDAANPELRWYLMKDKAFG